MQKLMLTIHKEKEVSGSKTSLKVFFFLNPADMKKVTNLSFLSSVF